MKDGESSQDKEVIKEPFDIFETVIKYMEMAELLHTEGEAKRTYVLTAVRIYMINTYGINYYRKYRTFIPLIIEFIVSISKNGIYLLLNSIWRD